MTDVRLVHGDCTAAMRAMDDASVDAVVCDPPYGLEFMGKEWDSIGRGSVFQKWAREWSIEALRVLRPGGHLVAFGGSRMYHRLAAGIEDAGFEIRDSLMWLYGSGFPKSLDVSKAIDKAAGAQRDPDVTAGERVDDNAVLGKGLGVGIVARGAATTPEAAAMDGWGTALKPAFEPAVLARKPFAGTVADNVLEHGTGAINIDATRVPMGPKDAEKINAAGGFLRSGWSRADGTTSDVYGELPATDAKAHSAGRWPANVMLTHHPECQGSGPTHALVLCHPDCPVRMLETIVPGSPRFFYCGKAQTRERIAGTVRNLHVTVKPIDLMRWLCRLVTPPGGVVLDPFMGSGSTGCAAVVEGFGFVGVEIEEASFVTSRERIAEWAFAYGREATFDVSAIDDTFATEGAS